MEGNQMKMREALERTDLFLSALGKWLKVNDECQEYALAAGVIHTLVEHALALPRRNCDVGTAEEQAQRFHDFCVGNSSGINGMCKPTCPFIDCFDKCQCLSKWAQMPYEAEEGGAK